MTCLQVSRKRKFIICKKKEEEIFLPHCIQILLYQCKFLFRSEFIVVPVKECNNMFP